MLEKAKTSCLTPADVKLLSFEPHVEAHDLDIYPKWAGFKIPYFTLAGKADSAFYRFRFLQTKPSTGFAALAEEPAKPKRYSQPAGTQCGVYLPPLLTAPDPNNPSRQVPLSWQEVSKNPDMSLVITEGELKAACACKHGIATIGLGGVYNWRSAKDNQSLLPILEKFVWQGRNVVICFDSDTKTNPMVRVAASRLAYVLAVKGALVRWAQLPPGEDGSKQGLDDLVFAQGIEALHTVLQDTEELGPGQELHRLNSEVAFVLNTVEVVELQTGNVYSSSGFTEARYKNRVYDEKDANNRLIRKFAAKEWMAWPLRTEVTALAYEPGCNNVITSVGEYNTWYPQRWPILPSKKGSLTPWEELFQHIFGGLEPKNQVWVKQWFACPIQRPGTKLATAILVWARQQGTGKTIIGETMKAIYGKNYGTVTNDQLKSQFNEWAMDKQFILGDEISVGDKRGLTNSLKDMITRTTVTLNPKNRKTYTVTDCINYFFTSNHEDAIYMESDDRRIFVCHADVTAHPPEYYVAYFNWLYKEGGAERLYYHLLNEVSLVGFQPKGRAPITAAKLEMAASGRGDTEDWAISLAANPDALLPKDKPYDLFTVEDLLRFFDPDDKYKTRAGGLGRALNAAGVYKVASGNSSVIEGVRRRLYAVRNADRYRKMGVAEARRLYEAERPAQFKVGGNNKFAPGGRAN